MRRREYMETHGDGFEVEVYVTRPPETQALLDSLSNEMGPGYSLSPREKEQCAISQACREVVAAVRLQAARIDPRTKARADSTEAEFRSAFEAAGLFPIFMERVPNEYCGPDSPYALGEPWFVVTSRLGHIKIGWRKRVINIDWSRAAVEQDPMLVFPDEDVTKGHGHIHAWGIEKAIEYLKRLNTFADTRVDQDPGTDARGGEGPNAAVRRG